MATIGTSTNAAATQPCNDILVGISPVDGVAVVLWFDGTNQKFSYAASPYTSWTTTTLASGSRFAAGLYMRSNGNADVVSSSSGGAITYYPLTESSGAYSLGTTAQVTSNAGTFNPGNPEMVLVDPQGRYWSVSNSNAATICQVYDSVANSPSTANWTSSLSATAASSSLLPVAGIPQNYLVAIYPTASTTFKYQRLEVDVASLGSWSAATTLSLSASPNNTVRWCFRGNGSGKGILVHGSNSAGSGIQAYTYTESSDTWSSATQLSTSTSDVSPTLVVDGSGNVYCFWCSFVASNNFALVYKKWTAGTSTWDTSATTLVASGTNITNPSGGFGKSTIGVVYSVGTASPFNVNFATISLATTSSRTVPATAALLQTKSRTVTCTAALLQTNTRTISSVSSALRTTSTRSVSATTALLTTKTRAITCSAALLVTSNRIVSDTTALRVTASRSIATDVALLQTKTRTISSTATLAAIRAVSCSVALLTQQSRTVSATAALVAIRTIPATTALLVKQSRTIPCSSALLVTTGRSIVATTALLQTDTRAVSTATALLTTNQRYVSCSVALKVTSTRTVGSNTAALLVTAKRTVTSAVALLQTDARSISATSALLVTSHRTVTATAALLVTSKRTISATAALSQPGATIRSVPASVALLTTSQRTISDTAAFLQTSTRAVSAHVALLVTGTRTISTSVALKITGVSRTISSAASLKTLGNTRVVGVHAALLQTNTRIVLASAALSAGKIIVCTVALKVVEARDIPVSATLTTGPPPASNAVVYVRSGQASMTATSGTAQITVTSGQATVHIR